METSPPNLLGTHRTPLVSFSLKDNGAKLADRRRAGVRLCRAVGYVGLCHAYGG